MLNNNGYIWIAKAICGSDAPVGSGTPAHVAYCRAGTWATWAEVPEPAGASDQDSDLGASIYPFKLSFPHIYMNFRVLVVFPSVTQLDTCFHEIFSKFYYLQSYMWSKRLELSRILNDQKLLVFSLKHNFW